MCVAFRSTVVKAQRQALVHSLVVPSTVKQLYPAPISPELGMYTLGLSLGGEAWEECWCTGYIHPSRMLYSEV